VRKGLLIAALVAAALPPATAWADPQFDLFKSFCLDTRGDPTKSLAAADAAGWTPIPTSMIKGFGASGSEILDPAGRMTSTQDGMRMMIVGTAKEIVPRTQRQGAFCAVFLQTGDVAALKAEAARYAAVPQDATIVDDKDAVAFAWRETPTGHERVSSKDLKTTAWDQSLTIVIAGSTGPSPIIALAVPTK
jgi:hypothetical protein